MHTRVLLDLHVIFWLTAQAGEKSTSALVGEPGSVPLAHRKGQQWLVVVSMGMKVQDCQILDFSRGQKYDLGK